MYLNKESNNYQNHRSVAKIQSMNMHQRLEHIGYKTRKIANQQWGLRDIYVHCMFHMVLKSDSIYS